jgi:ribosomal protein S12 methylthiotransferase accessory factor
VVLLELITNTNGACSGNTHTEALIHGICEIMERYVLVTAYTKPFTPPTIPPELFLGTEIYDRISGLVKQGLTVEIRDCSLGMRLPVIGVLIIDESKKRYLFHLGADPSPITALERCFTEIYQGGAPEFMPISDALPPNCDKKVITANFDEATRSNTGQWPDSLFLSKSSYSFLGFDFLISSSDKLDLKFLKEVLQENGFDVLARNVSFLGQPAFKVYIPGMSEITNVFDNRYLEALLKFEEHLNSMYKFRELESVADCEKLAIAIEDVIESSLSGRFNAPRPRYFNHLSYHSNRLDRKFTSDVILYFLNNKMEKKSVAKAHLHRIADSLGMRPEDREAFAHISDDLIVKSALGNMKFPSCFSCGNCGSEDVCSFSQIKRLWDVLRQKSSEFDFCLSDSLIADEKTGE